MKRRKFFLAAGLTTLASLSDFPLTRIKKAESKPSSTNESAKKKRMLFFDLWKLDYWDNCLLKQGTPEYISEATYEDNAIKGKGAGKPNVFFDNHDKVWRMLYNIGWSPVRLMAAISTDGINWHPDPHPEIDIPVESGKRIADHQVFQLKNTAAGGLYQDPVAKDGFPFKMYVQVNGEEVYKRALKNTRHPLNAQAKLGYNSRTFHEGRVLVSQDGLGWELHPDYIWSRSDWHPEPPYFGFYNNEQKKHTIVVRPGWGDRRVGVQTTEDFYNWSEPELLLQMDSMDKSPIGFYAMPVVPYGHMYIGLVWIFHNSSSQPVDSFNQFFGTMDTQFAYSYDGIRFFRGFREPILPLNSYPQAGCTQLRPYSIIDLDQEIRIYSGASQAPHGLERAMQPSGKSTNAIVMHRLRRDGWMYLESRGHWARIQTKPLGIWSHEILLNASAPFGMVRYQITDERSQPIENFKFEDCLPFKENDAHNWSMQWKHGKISDLIGKVIRIEIEFYNANIYSLTTNYHFLDAQDQWLMKDGQQIDPSRFDY